MSYLATQPSILHGLLHREIVASASSLAPEITARYTPSISLSELCKDNDTALSSVFIGLTECGYIMSYNDCDGDGGIEFRLWRMGLDRGRISDTGDACHSMKLYLFDKYTIQLPSRPHIQPIRTLEPPCNAWGLHGTYIVVILPLTHSMAVDGISDSDVKIIVRGGKGGWVDCLLHTGISGRGGGGDVEVSLFEFGGALGVAVNYENGIKLLVFSEGEGEGVEEKVESVSTSLDVDAVCGVLVVNSIEKRLCDNILHHPAPPAPVHLPHTQTQTPIDVIFESFLDIETIFPRLLHHIGMIECRVLDYQLSLLPLGKNACHISRLLPSHTLSPSLIYFTLSILHTSPRQKRGVVCSVVCVLDVASDALYCSVVGGVGEGDCYINGQCLPVAYSNDNLCGEGDSLSLLTLTHPHPHSPYCIRLD